MFASYSGSKPGRSLSTADVYRLGEGEPRTRSQLRRAPPAPPKRSDSVGSDYAINCKQTLTRVRSYLSDDIRRKFEVASAGGDSVLAAGSSPGSSNFVRKLVASLERRQSDCSPEPYDYEPRRCEPVRRRRDLVDAAWPALAFSPSRASQLEEVQEAREEEDEDYEEGSESSDDCLSDIWPGGQPDRVQQQAAPAEEQRKAGKRSLKNVLSSLINWRSGGKQARLPKGSRDYYAARESLGEELRAFRRDTMPGLMRRAAVNVRLRASDEASPAARFAPSSLRPERPAASTATIHPIYGSCRAAERVPIGVRPARPVSAVMHYDVPKSNQPIVVRQYRPHYQNLPAPSEPSPDSSTLFTTF